MRYAVLWGLFLGAWLLGYFVGRRFRAIDRNVEEHDHD